MPLQFRKQVKLAKGMYLNLSKSGVSMSVGTKGARMTIGKKGVTESFGIPGTGISYRKQQSWKAMAPKASSKTIVLPDKDREAQRLALARATTFDPRFKALRSFVYAITIFLWVLIAITGAHSPVILGYTIFASLYCILAVISIRALKKMPPPLPPTRSDCLRHIKNVNFYTASAENGSHTTAN
jgi:Protein of unknown function (DUF4236)